MIESVYTWETDWAEKIGSRIQIQSQSCRGSHRVGSTSPIWWCITGLAFWYYRRRFPGFWRHMAHASGLSYLGFPLPFVPSLILGLFAGLRFSPASLKFCLVSIKDMETFNTKGLLQVTLPLLGTISYDLVVDSMMYAKLLKLIVLAYRHLEAQARKSRIEWRRTSFALGHECLLVRSICMTEELYQCS